MGYGNSNHLIINIRGLFQTILKQRGWRGIFFNARGMRGGGISGQFISGYIGQIIPDLGVNKIEPPQNSRIGLHIVERAGEPHRATDV